MNTRDTYAGKRPMSRAPHMHRGASVQFKTYASAAHGLDEISPPLTAPPWSANLALGERLFIPDSALDPAIKAIAATFICVGIAVLLARISLFVI